jgi:valyl-tRNA synthetase
LVNPDTAKNIALRITLKPDQDGKEVNHSFVFPGSDAVAVRERFKEAIRRILAELQNSTATDTDQSNRQTATTTRPTKPTQSKLPEAIQLRMELLKSNKELQKLHRELVLAGHIGEEEFWANKKASHLYSIRRSIAYVKRLASSRDTTYAS